MRSILGGRLGTAMVMLALSGCFAVVDVDRFHTASSKIAGPDGSVLNPAGAYLNLKLSLVGMVPHVTQLFEYRIIDSNNFVQSRGVVNPLGATDVVINVPHAIPSMGAFHLDFYADVNGSGGYDGIGAIARDHAWRIDPLVDFPANAVPPVDGLVQVTFTHNTLFTDINTYPSGTPNLPHEGLAAVIHVQNADAFMGDLIQVHIVEPIANRTVGLFRVPRIAQGAFDLTIPGVLDLGVDYAIFIYVDANANGTYDNPASGLGDRGWALAGTSSATGLEVTFDAQTVSAANVDVGGP